MRRESACIPLLFAGGRVVSRGVPVLLGGRGSPRRRGAVGHVLFVWLPVMVMLAVIARESTAAFGAVNTSHFLRTAFQAIFGPVDDVRWETVHHYVRKTGHFIGYGTLGLTWLRAFLLLWLLPFRQHAAAVWRQWSLQMAICCTALVAAMDEVHQSYIPDRTGLVTDVLLDTTGALCLCGLVALWWLRSSARGARYSA